MVLFGVALGSVCLSVCIVVLNSAFTACISNPSNPSCWCVLSVCLSVSDCARLCSSVSVRYYLCVFVCLCLSVSFRICLCLSVCQLFTVPEGPRKNSDLFASYGRACSGGFKSTLLSLNTSPIKSLPLCTPVLRNLKL